MAQLSLPKQRQSHPKAGVCPPLVNKESAETNASEDPSGSVSTNSVNEFPSPESIIVGGVTKFYREIQLRHVDLTFNNVREDHRKLNLDQVHNKVMHGHVARAKASICFVVKRPGCVLCHEQGHDLKKLVQEFPDQSVAAWATIKEIDVDNEGLLDLYQKHFKFPFYKDSKLSMYKALGDRRVNLLTVLRRYVSAKKRWESKGLNGNMIGKGEGMLLGGIMIFDKKGELQYVHQEKFGKELPIDEIRLVLQTVIAQARSSSRLMQHSI